MKYYFALYGSKEWLIQSRSEGRAQGAVARGAGQKRAQILHFLGREAQICIVGGAQIRHRFQLHPPPPPEVFIVGGAKTWEGARNISILPGAHPHLATALDSSIFF